MILMDTAEPSKIEDELEGAGIVVVRERLPVGDYVVGDFLIERKDSKDLLHSIYDNRLYKQLSNLKHNESGHIPVLFVHGPVPPRHRWVRLSKGRPMKVAYTKEELAKRERTIISSLSTGFNSFKGVNIIVLKDIEQFLGFIIDLYYRQTAKKPTVRPVVKIRAEDPEDYKWAMLSQLPGVGSKGSTVICKLGIPIAELSQMSVEDLEKKIPRVGKKRAKAIYQVLHI